MFNEKRNVVIISFYGFPKNQWGCSRKGSKGDTDFLLLFRETFLTFWGPQKRLQEMMNFDRDLLGKHGEFYKTHKVRKKHVVDIFTVME